MLLTISEQTEIVHHVNIQFPCYWKDPSMDRVTYFMDENKCIVVSNWKNAGSTIEESITKAWIKIMVNTRCEARPEDFAGAFRRAIERLQTLCDDNEPLSIAIQNELF